VTQPPDPAWDSTPPPTTRQRRLPRPVGLTIVALLVLGLIAGIGLGGRALYRSAVGVPDYAGPGTGEVLVQVSPGDSASAIAATLLGKDVVKSAKAFTEAALADERSTGIQPGFYRLRLQMSGAGALSLLLDPSSRVRGRVTFPEGIPISTVIERFGKFTELKPAAVQAAIENPAVLGLPDYAKNRPEGFLFPATYDIEPGTAAVDAVQQMTAKFEQVAAEIDLVNRALALGLTPYQLVVVASLVEAESPLDDDRAKVARVVLNRLANDMPLQFDSTVNYVRAEKKIRLSLKDIAVESPYNTYQNKGLPPTPINSPGQSALEAALSPAEGDWLYFVAIDKQGRSFFTSDYDAFLEAKAKAKREGVF
jgi:UPF0755 protein